MQGWRLELVAAVWSQWLSQRVPDPPQLAGV